LLNGYSFLGSLSANSGTKGITWANQGTQFGLLAVIDSSSLNYDFTFNLPPITTVNIDEINHVIISNSYVG
jgi:hypothetical protein